MNEEELKYFKNVNKSITTLAYNEGRDFLFVIQLLEAFIPKEKIDELYNKWCKNYREINKDLDVFEYDN